MDLLESLKASGKGWQTRLTSGLETGSTPIIFNFMRFIFGDITTASSREAMKREYGQPVADTSDTLR